MEEVRRAIAKARELYRRYVVVTMGVRPLSKAVSWGDTGGESNSLPSNGRSRPLVMEARGLTKRAR